MAGYGNTSYNPAPAPFIGGRQPSAQSVQFPFASIGIASHAATALLATVLTAWTPVDSQPQQARNLNPALLAPTATVDNPPFTSQGREPWVNNIVQSWQPPDPSPTLGGKLSPALNPSTDNPPFTSGGRNTSVNPILAQWWFVPDPRVIPPYYIRQPDVAPLLPVGPLDPSALPIILQWWVGGDPPLPTLPGKLNPATLNVVPDNPPFGLLETLVGLWEPPGPPTLGGKLNPAVLNVVPDNPPFGLLETVTGFWDPPNPLPTLPRKLVQSGAGAPDNPPFTSRGRVSWVNDVLRAWQPPDPQPILRGKLLPSALNVIPDNPPFGLLETVIGLWDPPAAQQPTLGNKLNPTALAPAADTPPGEPGLDIVVVPLDRWLPQVAARLSPALLNVTPDNPPFTDQGREPWVNDVLRTWQPPPPLPTLSGKVSPAVLNVVPDNPPFGLLETVIGLWEPQAPLPTLGGKLSPAALNVTPDNPPFSSAGRKPWVVNVLVSWQPPPPLPTLAGKVNPATLNVTPDNPPFGPLETVIGLWDPQASLPTLGNKLNPATLAPPIPVPLQGMFTVSGQTVESLFHPVGDISWNWGGGVQKRTT